ncbi:recombination protein Rad52 [Clavulina sp. PMI_390]|nr:recombination protein Rad52 [Clavulina sp. PMI_390]
MSTLAEHLAERFETSDHHSPMSFDPAIHGGRIHTALPQVYPSHSAPAPFSPQAFQPRMGLDTALKIEELAAKLNQRLGPEYLSTRPGPGGGPKLTYIEGWKAINLANEVFGFQGWSSSISSITVDYIDYNPETQRYNIGVGAIVRVTLRDGTYHEDTGYGTIENVKQKGAGIDKCKKEAITDGVKRALRSFGNVLGNCLYDKNFIKEVMKVPVGHEKFDRAALHRRPEFALKKTSAAHPPGPTSAQPAPSPSITSVPHPAAPPAAHGPSKPNPSHQTSSPLLNLVANNDPIRSSNPHAAESGAASSSKATSASKSRMNSSSAARQAAIAAAMAEDIKPIAPPQPELPTRPASPANKRTASEMEYSFSEDDHLFAEINLECYDVSNGDVSIGADTTLVEEVDALDALEQQIPPVEMKRAEQVSRPPPSRGPQRQPVPLDPAVIAARTARRMNLFNDVLSAPSQEDESPHGSAGRKRNSDEISDAQSSGSSEKMKPVSVGQMPRSYSGPPSYLNSGNPAHRASLNPFATGGEAGSKRLKR